MMTHFSYAVENDVLQGKTILENLNFQQYTGSTILCFVNK